MRQTSIGILAIAIAAIGLTACETTLPAPVVQRQAPSTPVVAGFGKTPVNAGFGADPVTAGYHDTQSAPTYQP